MIWKEQIEIVSLYYSLKLLGVQKENVHAKSETLCMLNSYN